MSTLHLQFLIWILAEWLNRGQLGILRGAALEAADQLDPVPQILAGLDGGTQPSE